MTNEELKNIVEKHKKWLNNEDGGERAYLSGAYLSGADLSGAYLSGADLSGADLSWADLRGAYLSRANLSSADLRGAYLSGADLSWADLSGADLSWADLSRADIDYSCLPLWCGSLTANFDDRQLKQIAYHLVKSGLNSTNASEETKKELSKLIDFANGFHRANECGLIEFSEKDGGEMLTEEEAEGKK